MFSVLDIIPIYTFTVFLCFVIFYLSLSFLALMHFYHVFIACSLYSLGMSIIYSCHITYAVHVIFLYIYYFHTYILYHLLCSIFIYCYHVLFMYYVHVLISYTVFMYCFMYCTYTMFMYSFHILFSCFTFHITFSFILDHFTFLYIFIYDVGLYNLMLQNLSSHSSAMLLISYHIFSHVIFKSFVLCFMSA